MFRSFPGADQLWLVLCQTYLENWWLDLGSQKIFEVLRLRRPCWTIFLKALFVVLARLSSETCEAKSRSVSNRAETHHAVAPNHYFCTLGYSLCSDTDRHHVLKCSFTFVVNVEMQPMLGLMFSLTLPGLPGLPGIKSQQSMCSSWGPWGWLKRAVNPVPWKVGKLADLCLWQPAFFGSKPEMVRASPCQTFIKPSSKLHPSFK